MEAVNSSGTKGEGKGDWGTSPPSSLKDRSSNLSKFEEKKLEEGRRLLARFNSLLFHTTAHYHVPLLFMISGE